MATGTTGSAGTDEAELILRPGRPDDAEAIAALIERDNRRPADRAEIGGCSRRIRAWSPTRAASWSGSSYPRPFSPDILELRNMAVATGRRRRGVGRRIAETIEAEVRRRGYHAVIGANCWLHQGASRDRAAAARAFWLNMGWHIIFATEGLVVLAKWLQSG